MNVHRLAASAMVRAPAKLNLFFEVLAKRNDGFHEIETLMVPISLYDTLVATPDPTGQIHLDCRWALPGATDSTRLTELGELPTECENLATRAVALLRERAGVKLGVRLELVKQIPAAAGLGGGSADAAAALLAANEIWQLGWSRKALAVLAAELGSDVPFFLGCGAAVCRGRGEIIEPAAGLGALHFVVARPPEGLSTARVYGQVEVPAEPRRLAPLLDALRAGDLRRLPSLIHNRLERAAEPLSPWVGRLKWELERADCAAAQMSGSGTGYFGICRSARHARRVAHTLQARGIGHVYAVSSCN